MGGSTRSRAHFFDEIDYCVEALSGDADDVARTVFDAEHKHAAAAVCKCRKLVSEGIPMRAGDAVTGEADFLEFQERTFAEANLVEQLLRAIEHASAPAPTGDIGVRTPRARPPSPGTLPHAWHLSAATPSA